MVFYDHTDKCFQIYNIQSVLVNTSDNNASGTSTNIDNVSGATS